MTRRRFRRAALLCLLMTFTVPTYAGILNRTPPGYDPKTLTKSGARQHLVVDESGKAVGYYSDGRAVERTIAGTSTVDASRAGKLVLDLARNLIWPVNLALSAYDIICSETDICKQADGTWSKKVDLGRVSVQAGWVRGCAGGCVINNVPGSTGAIVQAAQEFISARTTDAFTCETPPSPESSFACRTLDNIGGPAIVFWTSQGTGVTLPVTDIDWMEAEPKLKDKFGQVITSEQGQPWIEALSGLAPMPVNLTWPQTSWKDATQTTTVRDSKGNVQSVVTRTPSNTTVATNNSTVIKFTESVVTTTTGYVNGAPQPSVTSTEVKPQDDSTPPKREDVELDTVDDLDLQTQEIGAFSYTPAGGGSACPADPVVTVLGHSLTIPGHVLCDYATMMRTVVLLVFGVIAAGIVAGARSES